MTANWCQWPLLMIGPGSFSQVELGGLERPTPCMQKRRKLSDTVAHLGLRLLGHRLGSGLVGYAASRIRAGVAPFGVPSDWARGMAEDVARAARFPPLILVLEGYARLTAFMLARDRLPQELGC
jgi:hypothetical protein